MIPSRQQILQFSFALTKWDSRFFLMCHQICCWSRHFIWFCHQNFVKDSKEGNILWCLLVAQHAFKDVEWLRDVEWLSVTWQIRVLKVEIQSLSWVCLSHEWWSVFLKQVVFDWHDWWNRRLSVTMKNMRNVIHRQPCQMKLLTESTHLPSWIHLCF